MIEAYIQKLSLFCFGDKADEETKQAIINLTNIRKNKWVPLKTVEEKKEEYEEKKGELKIENKNEQKIFAENFPVKIILEILQRGLQNDVVSSVNFISCCKRFYNNKLLDNYLWKMKHFHFFHSFNPWCLNLDFFDFSSSFFTKNRVDSLRFALEDHSLLHSHFVDSNFSNFQNYLDCFQGDNNDNKLLSQIYPSRYSQQDNKLKNLVFQISRKVKNKFKKNKFKKKI